MTERAFTVALIGPDGAGKTTIARRLERELGLPAKYLYMGVSAEASSHALPTTRALRALKRKLGRREPPGPPSLAPVSHPRSRVRRALRCVKSWLHIANQLSEEWYRQLVASRHVRRGEIVIFDRHFLSDFWAHDIDSSARRSRAQRLHGYVLARFYPRPDVIVFLDAPAETLFARKPEGTLLALARRRREYQRFAAELGNVEVVDAGLPLESALNDVAEAIYRQALWRAADRRLAQA